jgi:hypothetical protein
MNFETNVTNEQVGSVGELIAAIATVAMPAHLAVQIRQNAQVAVASMADPYSEAQNEVPESSDPVAKQLESIGPK